MGLLRWAFMPAARVLAMSSGKALAVRAMMGIAGTYAAAGRQAVHDRHLGVHQDQIKGPVLAVARS